MKYADCYREAVRLLENNGVKEAGLDARLLLEYVCGTDRNTLLAHPEREVSDEDEARFRELLEDVVRGNRFSTLRMSRNSWA